MNKLDLMNKVINKVLTEVKMSDVELLKPNSSTGEPRTHILLKRIIAKEPVELDNGQEIIIDPKKSTEFIAALKSGDEDIIVATIKPEGKYADVIFDTTGKSYKITAFKKAAYFGGGAGSSKSNAQKTAWQESAQAAALGIALNLRRKLRPSDLTPENVQKASNRIDVDSSVDEMMTLIKEPQWQKSLVNATNEILDKFKLTGMIIHRGSSWVKSLEDKFNAVNRDEAGKVFPGKDKWNPSDIWAVKKGVTVPTEINDLAELNAWIERMFELGNVIGFSLKLTPKNTKSKIFNLDRDVDDLLDISIKNLIVSKTNNLFRSKDGQIIYENVNSLSSILTEDEMSIRSFKAQDNVSGEIAGKYAAGGKIGFGPLNHIMRKLKLGEITHRKELAKKLVTSQKKDKAKYYGELIKEIIAMASTVSPEVANVAKKNIAKIAADSDFNRLATKYQAVQALSTVKQASPKKQRDFIQHVIQYASSQSELSSVFVKVW